MLRQAPGSNVLSHNLLTKHILPWISKDQESDASKLDLVHCLSATTGPFRSDKDASLSRGVLA